LSPHTWRHLTVSRSNHIHRLSKTSTQDTRPARISTRAIQRSSARHREHRTSSQQCGCSPVHITTVLASRCQGASLEMSETPPTRSCLLKQMRALYRTTLVGTSRPTLTQHRLLVHAGAPPSAVPTLQATVRVERTRH
jgi:hypothetical protein